MFNECLYIWCRQGSVQFKVLICMNNTLSGRWVAHKSLKTKEKSSRVTPKSGCNHLQQLCTEKFKSQFKWGFTKVVITIVQKNGTENMQNCSN